MDNRLNILMVMADQLTALALGYYGNEVVKAPQYQPPGLALRHRKYPGKLLQAMTTTSENSFLPAIHVQEMAFVVPIPSCSA